MNKLRVAQWTTGKVGTQALRAILDDPRLELVGVFAYSSDKAGQDAGTMCGRDDCGVAATDKVEDIIAARPDAVVYNPFMADLDQVEALLSAGINVSSTNLFLNCGGIVGETQERLEKACEAGNSSLYITGVNPGWINNIAASLTAVCRHVDRVSITESTDVSNYSSKETWDAMGMGQQGASEQVYAVAQGAMVSFRDAAVRIAEALGIELDAVDFELEYAPVSEDIDLGYMQLPKGTNGALRSAWSGKVGGKEVVRVSVAWYLTEKLDCDWEFDDDHYRVVIEGEPTVDTRIKFVAPDWSGSDWSILTALPAVSVVPQLVAAPAGILGLSDVGLPAAPVGDWMKA